MTNSYLKNILFFLGFGLLATCRASLADQALQTDPIGSQPDSFTINDPVKTKTGWGSPDQALSKYGIYDLGGKLFIDRSLEVSGASRADRYLELVGISTPTTPSLARARMYLSSSTYQFCAVFDNGSIACGVPAGSSAIASLTTGYGIGSSGASANPTIYLKSDTTSYVQNRTSLQSDTTFYVSNGNIANNLFFNGGTETLMNFNASGTHTLMRAQTNCLFTGSDAGANSTCQLGGVDNNAYGSGALATCNSDGNNNCHEADAFGGNSQANNVGGFENASFGFDTLLNLTTADDNVVMGAYSGRGITTGGSHSLFGFAADTAVVTGVGNSCFGFAACEKMTGSKEAAFGYQALGSQIGTNPNTCFGGDACENLTTGGFNTGVGQLVMAQSAMTGNDNTSVGYQAGYGLTTGSENVLIGLQTGESLTTASSTTFVGSQIALNATTGSPNDAFGFGAGGGLTTGSNNTFMGYLSGVTGTSANKVTTGVQNVFIGANSGPSTSSQLTNAICIGYNCTAASSNTITLGTANGVIISSPNVKINGVQHYWPSSQGGAGTFLKNDGAGVLSWAATSASAGGSSGQIQYNNAGALGGVPSSYDGTTLTISTPTAIVGNISGTAASAGNYGEVLSSAALSTNAPNNSQYGDLVNISLTKGSWMIIVRCEEVLNGAVTTGLECGYSTTSGNSATGLTSGDTLCDAIPATAVVDSGCNIAGTKQVSVTTTVYLKMLAVYSAGTPKFVGKIMALRIN